MTNSFGPEWPLWELKVPRSQLVDTLAHPAGGLALIELENDPQPLISAIAEQAEEVISPSANGRHDWYYKTDPYGAKVNSWPNKSPEDGFDLDQTLLSDLAVETAGILRGYYEEQFVDVAKKLMLSFFVLRRSTIGVNHHDPEPALMWLGASAPGFRVLHRDKWIAIDNLPPHHALALRGRDRDNDNYSLLPSPTVHTVNYRRPVRRVSAVAG